MTDLKWTISEPANELFAALAKAQGKIDNATKDAINPHFKSKYADLASVWDACRGPLSENGLCVIQIPSADGPLVSVVTILGHTSGQKMSCELSATARTADPQSIGSVLTYLKRYSLSSVAGVPPEDDDGNAGTGSPEQHERPRQTQHGRDRRDQSRQTQSGEENQTNGHDPAKPNGLQWQEFVDRLKKIGAKSEAECDKIIGYVVPGESRGTCWKSLATLQSVMQGIDGFLSNGETPEGIYTAAMRHQTAAPAA